MTTVTNIYSDVNREEKANLMTRIKKYISEVAQLNAPGLITMNGGHYTSVEK